MLVDELAHSNLAGSRHPKRWQDIEELIAAGIDVWTTVNVQHLESLNDIVGGITGVRVGETLPDRLLDEADEIVLVDLPPDELLQRLREGKVYLPQQAARAIHNFFRKGNLIALRELALRRTAERVDDEMKVYRTSQSIRPVWKASEAMLAAVGPAPASEAVVRATARLAAMIDARWHAVYVETPGLRRLSKEEREAILATLDLAEELGAETATLSGPDAAVSLAEYARRHNLGRILMGRERPGFFRVSAARSTTACSGWRRRSTWCWWRCPKAAGRTPRGCLFFRPPAGGPSVISTPCWPASGPRFWRRRSPTWSIRPTWR